MPNGKIRIESDGTTPGTKVTCNGEPIHGVKRFRLRADARDHILGVVLEVEDVELDVFGEHFGTWQMRAYCLRSRLRRIKSGLTLAFGR